MNKLRGPNIMTQSEVIDRLCRIVGMAYRSIGDYTHPSDCFCTDGPKLGSNTFQHAGLTLTYVEQAVRERLIRDGYKIVEG